MDETHWWLASAACFAAFAVLGAIVARGTPMRADVEAGMLRGAAPSLALFFTTLGRWYGLVVLVALAAVLTRLWHGNLVIIGALVASQLLSQGAVILAKRFFGRSRPDRWIMVREIDLSYPSGHAVTTVVFFVALLVLESAAVVPRPWAIALGVLLLVCIIGIPWSRLALSAHYLTDVAGGLLFGCAWLFATCALISHLR